MLYFSPLLRHHVFADSCVVATLLIAYFLMFAIDIAADILISYITLRYAITLLRCCRRCH